MLLILFFQARQVSNSTALQEEGEEREEGRRAEQTEEGGTHVESDSSPVEVSSAPQEDPSTEALTLLTAARFALQPSSSMAQDTRQRISEAANPLVEPTVTSPMATNLRAPSTSAQTRGEVLPQHFSWNAAVNQAPWPLLGSTSQTVQVPSFSDAPPSISSPIESVKALMASTIRSTTFPVLPSTSRPQMNQFPTMTSYPPLGEPHPRQVTPMYPQAARWESGTYSGYQRGQDWPHQKGKEVVWSQETPFPFPHRESYCERKHLPQANQSNLIQTDQRNLENPPQMSFAEQSRPSVIKSVRKKITSGQN